MWDKYLFRWEVLKIHWHIAGTEWTKGRVELGRNTPYWRTLVPLVQYNEVSTNETFRIILVTDYIYTLANTLWHIILKNWTFVSIDGNVTAVTHVWQQGIYGITPSLHYSDVIMGAMASQITSLTTVYSTVYSRRRSKKKSKLRVTGLCAGNSPATGEFPAQMASNAENVYIWWRHHVIL